jgi:hypothetical protein
MILHPRCGGTAQAVVTVGYEWSGRSLGLANI